ncbi:MAG: hypothetical protein WC829_23425 [Hyphomicrobium sp.]|jgi:hypothetical protein
MAKQDVRHSSEMVWYQRQRAINRWVRFYRGQAFLFTLAERTEFIERNRCRFAKHSFACACHTCRGNKVYDSFAFNKRSFYRALDQYEAAKWSA